MTQSKVKQIKVAQTNLASLSELVGIILEVKSENIVRFASGDQTYFVVEHNGEEFEVAERFCEAVYTEAIGNDILQD